MGEQAPDLDQTLKGYRDYLSFQICVLVSPWLKNHLDLSGIVDEVLVKAWQALRRVEGWGEGERAAWLRTVLANQVKDEIDRLRAQCRDVGRNRSLEAALDESSARLAGALVAPQSSPSEAAQRGEQELRLVEAVQRLPEAQREALVLQRWHNWSLAQIAERLGRTPEAVAGLLHRALKQLRQELQEQG